ncbi:NfeD family protein [Pseudomonas zeae]|uniref:NfeD family protein n=1 Tax=Pseudomonas zeae TaxID=2745510 RepID=UPI0039E1A8D2
MLMQGWIWIVVALVLAVVEIATLGFFILWFALGALGVALLVWAWPDLPLASQMLGWAAMSCLMAFIWFGVQKRRRIDSRWTASAVLGEAGLLTATVSEFQKGRVRFQKPILGNEEWVCVSDQSITSGARVRLVAVEGNTVRVEQI